MTVLVGALAVGAALAWIAAVIGGIRMMGQLSGRLSLGSMLLRGIEWFDARNFKPEAAGPRRLFLRGFAAFFVCLLGMAVVSVIGAGRW